METTLTIKNDEGLHARPAAMLVKTATGFKSDIQLKSESKQANAKSLMSVMSLGLKKDASFTVIASGEDESEAVAQITDLVNNKFNLY